MNYAISMLLAYEMEKTGESYKEFNKLLGVMECAKLEFYRKRIAEYEDKKIAINGDLEI